MAYDNTTAAYSLDLFRESTAPKLPEKKKTEKKSKNKVVTLPQEALLKIRRRHHNPFKVFVGAVTGAVITAIVALIIVGQVQLTELNQQIISTKAELSTAQSTNTQRNMAIQSRLSSSDIEDYAREKLGMTKATNAQKEYVSLSKGDKAEISRAADKNFFEKVWDSISGLWS